MRIPPRLFLLLLVATLALPAAASASPRQITSFEAPGELLDDQRRDAALDEIQGFGVDHVRVLVYWRRFTPDADSRRKPSFDLKDPAPTRPATGAISTG